jgi:hypothetical protein
MRDDAAHEPRPRRVLLPRLERAAMVLLEVADHDLAVAVAAVLVAHEAHERDAA